MSKSSTARHADPCTCYNDPEYGSIVGSRCSQFMGAAALKALTNPEPQTADPATSATPGSDGVRHTRPMTITEFLLARIAEDERAAHDASPGPWSYSDIDSVGGGTIYDPTVAIANVEWDSDHVDSRIRRTRPIWQADATGIHIARHDPARVLAECASKRAIIEYFDDGRDADGKAVLLAMAAVYKDHPDYEEALNGG